MGGTVLLAGARGGATAWLVTPPRTRHRLYKGFGVHVDMTAERLLPHKGRKISEGQGLGLVPPEDLLSLLRTPTPTPALPQCPPEPSLEKALHCAHFQEISSFISACVEGINSELTGYKLMTDTGIHHENE